MRKSYEVTVGVPTNPNDEVLAAAAASRWLAYADQTDTFGYLADIKDVEPYTNDVEVCAVAITFTAPFPSDDDVKAFMDEMAHLSRVETVEEVSIVEP